MVAALAKSNENGGDCVRDLYFVHIYAHALPLRPNPIMCLPGVVNGNDSFYILLCIERKGSQHGSASY